MFRLLLSNALILKGETFTPVRGFLAVEDDTISYIGPDRPEGEPAREIDLHGAIVLPGLVNAHGHAAMVLLRGLGSGLPLDRWLNEAIFPAEARLTLPMEMAAVRLAQMEMLACGTTSYTDMYDFAFEEAALTAETGMKVNLGRPVLSFDARELPAESTRFREAAAFQKEWDNAANGRIRAEFCVHAEYTNRSLSILEAVGDLAALRHSRIHIHLSETAREHAACVRRYGMTPAALLEHLGLLRSPLVAAHCVHLSREDRGMLRQYDFTPVHCPASNMKLGSGFAPVPDFLSDGFTVALGTDGASSNNCLNMFREMYLAALLHKGVRGDASVLTARDVLHMATRAGALAQGRPETGLLETGMKADLCAVDAGRIHLFPLLDPVDTLVYSAQGSDVILTAVDGRILYENGVWTAFDAEEVRARVKEAARALYGA
ncbi:MAG: amidohydrolase [Lachnospiraceae bacterium]|nr:amidohydrolase [Lachnospiraceae bacterium]